MSSQLQWHNLSEKKVFVTLKTHPDGLTPVEVKKRQAESMQGTLPKPHKASFFKIFFSQFHNALIYILLLASAISWFLKDIVDAEVILAAVLVQVIMGCIQEYRANRSLERLYSVIKPKARVIRQGREQEVDRTEVVMGDVISLVAGDTVPADARIFEAVDLQVNESVLTGESLPVEKKVEVVPEGTAVADRHNMVYLSTLIVSGSGKAVVVATGLETEVGAVAHLLDTTEQTKTPLQRRLNHFSYQISLLIITVSVIIFFLGLLARYPIVEMFSLAVALAVAAIPEGLVIGVTVVLTIGMQRILRRHGLVRSLQAAETLGSTTIICTDKTGTLTVGEMSLVQIYTDSAFVDVSKSTTAKAGLSGNAKKVVSYMGLSNDAVIENPQEEVSRWTILGTPTERALLVAAGEQGFVRAELEASYKRLDTIPFSSDRKYMVTLHEMPGKKEHLLIIKGAPEKILEFVSRVQEGARVENLTASKKQELQQAYQTMSRKGFRVLACAAAVVSSNYRSLDSEDNEIRSAVFHGFVALSDSIRPEAAETIRQATQAGIRTIMITGDNKQTARTIAKSLKLPVEDHQIIEGGELITMTDAELRRRVKTISVYARVSPKDKLRIVQAWQSHGAIVAMTGDGINDAPALKTADIGVALGSGSDVAKETADLVLLDNNFGTIVSAVREGRVIASNISKVVLYLLAGSFSEVIVILLALVFVDSHELLLPLAAAQVLWLNLVTDSFPQLALTVEPEEENVLLQMPTPKKAPILTLEGQLIVILVSLVSGAGAFFVYINVLQHGESQVLAQTSAFATLGVTTVLYAYSLRNLRRNIWQYNVFSNSYLNIAIVASFLLQMAAIYLPFFQTFLGTTSLQLQQWVLVMQMALVTMVLIEIVKFVFNHFSGKHKK